mmetsp:Transcript_2154/g.4381  ORF Transcript_2154/g.4381 Transcript_2154/m.4381 type:complete len:242 (-) Transcript_2154:655-1380(-)
MVTVRVAVALFGGRALSNTTKRTSKMVPTRALSFKHPAMPLSANLNAGQPKPRHAAGAHASTLAVMSPSSLSRATGPGSHMFTREGAWPGAHASYAVPRLRDKYSGTTELLIRYMSGGWSTTTSTTAAPPAKSALHTPRSEQEMPSKHRNSPLGHRLLILSVRVTVALSPAELTTPKVMLYSPETAVSILHAEIPFLENLCVTRFLEHAVTDASSTPSLGSWAEAPLSQISVKGENLVQAA